MPRLLVAATSGCVLRQIAGFCDLDTGTRERRPHALIVRGIHGRVGSQTTVVEKPSSAASTAVHFTLSTFPYTKRPRPEAFVSVNPGRGNGEKDVMRTLVALCTTFLLLQAATASAEKLHNVKKATANTRIVYGGFDDYADGAINRKSRATLFVLPAGGGRALEYNVRESDDGVFYWDLPPGDYLLVGLLFPGPTTAHIGAEFRVPESGGDIYIGTVAVVWPQISIQDQFDRAARMYDGRFPERAGTSVNDTLQVPRIGNYASIHDPCDPEWGVRCEDKGVGVTPLTPTVEYLPDKFPRIQSLTPTFSWEPSQREGVSYDLIIYEWVKGSFGPAYVSVKGKVVRYEEGLTEPRWQTRVPLESNTRYYWSVRLRQGDRVTAWSTQGHFVFLLFAWSSGSGQWFEFRTP